jgi:hypothetical protein
MGVDVAVGGGVDVPVGSIGAPSPLEQATAIAANKAGKPVPMTRVWRAVLTWRDADFLASRDPPSNPTRIMIGRVA